MVAPNRPLITEISRTLGNAVSPSYIASANHWDVYEVYIFCLILEQAWKAGAIPPSPTNPVFMNRDGTPATSYTFRTGPGRLNASEPYTYAVINFPNKQPLEVHTGIFVCENSAEKTEIDVCVIKQEEADYFRNNNVKKYKNSPPHWWPRPKHILIAIECKYLTGNLRARQAHEFIGRCKSLNQSTEFYLITNASSKAIAAEHRVRNNYKNAWKPNAVPSSTIDVDGLKGSFREVFSAYAGGHRHSI